MIIKASQRAGGNQLAAHLLNARDNEHVTVRALRGFVASDLRGAFQEVHAISRATKCKQYLFSLSLNPPKDAIVGEGAFERAADEAERRLNLVGQPRAIILHEKEGRRHAHVVWSRIDADALRAINLPFYKRTLNGLARDLYLEHEWTLPEGLRTHGGRSPLNFTLDEWQHVKRLGRDPREIKDAIRACWQRSDNAKALAHALEERGYFLARGDKRGFVVLDTDGEVFSLARYAGIKTKEVREKLGTPDHLPSVEDKARDLRLTTSRQVAGFIGDFKKRQADELNETQTKLTALVFAQRGARVDLRDAHSARWEQETMVRAARFRRGLAGLWDMVTGRKRHTRAQNERETEACRTRDRYERDALVADQFERRRPFQAEIDRTRKRQMGDRRLLARQIAEHRQRLRRAEARAASPSQSDEPRPRARGRGAPTLDR